jgi:hypothetical protein
VLIIGESCICAFLLSALLQFYLVIIPCIIILSLHLLSTSHKCIQPCYFPLLFKLATHKIDMKNSLTRSSRLAVLWLLSCGLWSLLLFCFHESHLSIRHYLCNNYIVFMIFGYLWELFVHMCRINDPRHTCDEYSVLFAKSGMTLSPLHHMKALIDKQNRNVHAPLCLLTTFLQCLKIRTEQKNRTPMISSNFVKFGKIRYNLAKFRLEGVLCSKNLKNWKLAEFTD